MRRIRPFVSSCIVLVASVIASDAATQPLHPREGRGPEAGLQLVGTVAGPREGLAIIRQSDGHLHILKTGRDVRGYALTTIEPTRVVLKKDERELTLELPLEGRPETPVGRLAAARQRFTETLGLLWADLGGGEAWHEGNSILIAGPSGLLEASVPVPEELVGDGSDLPD